MGNKKKHLLAKKRKGWLSEFFDKIITEIAKFIAQHVVKIIGSIIFFFILGILGFKNIDSIHAFVNDILLTRYETIKSDKKNISPAEALSIAKIYVGPEAVEAKPFRNKDNDRQYIAVMTNLPTSGSFSKIEIVLLEGNSSVYKNTETGIILNGVDPHPNVMQIEDVQKDGNKEIFTNTGFYGNSGYTKELRIYDTIIHKVYELDINVSYYRDNATILDPPGEPDDEVIANWMLNKAKDDIPNRLDGENAGTTYSWEKIHGVGFHSGKLHITEVPGRLVTGPNSSLGCHVDDGDYEWDSIFKGGVYGYDKKRNTSFIVYVPQLDLNWVDSLISGNKYLWIDAVFDGGILVYNKEDQSLEIIPVPEIRNPTLNRDPELVKGKPILLSYQDLSLYWRSEKLTLPQNINVEKEFENSFTCINK